MLNKHLLSACKTTEQAKTVAHCLAAALLTAEEANMAWGAKLMAIENILGKRIPSLEQAARPDEEDDLYYREGYLIRRARKPPL